MNRHIKNIGLLGLSLLLVNCPGASGDRTTMEYIPEMLSQASLRAQEAPRMPPAGTIPRGYLPYPFAIDQGELAQTVLKNPLPVNRATLLDGKRVFENNCSVCHGPVGKGDGSIVPKFPMPPSLNSDKVKDWPDGRIFHVVSAGQNLMPSYASQVFPEERWAVIHYVRALQRAVSPTDEDVKLYEQMSQ